MADKVVCRLKSFAMVWNYMEVVVGFYNLMEGRILGIKKNHESEKIAYSFVRPQNTSPSLHSLCAH